MNKLNDTLETLAARQDAEFKAAKEDITFPLRGDNKYYYAAQCALFHLNVQNHGYDHIATREKILAEGIQFNKYSITLGHQYGYDLKRFNSKEEMFGFVIGYNEAINNFEQAKQSKEAA